AYAVGVLDSEERFINWLDYVIPAGATHSFQGSFIMWDRDVTIHAYSYIEDEDGFVHLDNEAAKDVKLGVVPGCHVSSDETEGSGQDSSNTAAIVKIGSILRHYG
ncbi:unnamed protein product, partial [marine sediment metagenome]